MKGRTHVDQQPLLALTISTMEATAFAGCGGGGQYGFSNGALFMLHQQSLRNLLPIR